MPPNATNESRNMTHLAPVEEEYAKVSAGHPSANTDRGSRPDPLSRPTFAMVSGTVFYKDLSWHPIVVVIMDVIKDGLNSLIFRETMQAPDLVGRSLAPEVRCSGERLFTAFFVILLYAHLIANVRCVHRIWGKV